MKKSVTDALEGKRDLELLEQGSWPLSQHRFDNRSLLALDSAMAARRPLLIRGEPGIGKSQIARAAAVALNVPLLSQVVHPTSECGELLYTYDAVSRLAQAQLIGTAGQGWKDGNWEAHLAEERFVRPGVLWWAFDWNDALRQAEKIHHRKLPKPDRPDGWTSDQGCVVLIDEIDKADSDLPNSLLESLGNGGFQLPFAGRSVRCPKEQTPLVIITTNEERELPAAFLRRCLVLNLPFPQKPEAQRSFLEERGRVKLGSRIAASTLFTKAAERLLADREIARKRSQPLPGAAEYLDLLEAVAELHPFDAKAQEDALMAVSEFTFQKHPFDETP